MMVRSVVVTLVAVATAGAVAVATGATGLPEPVQNTLTTIDTVPTKTQLDNAFDDDELAALTNLSTIAQDDTADVGIRLRAVHALAKYCDPCATTEVAHQSLSSLIATTRNELSGSSLLLLRAAIETIGMLGIDTDVNVLIPLLDHPSRDIRAATARSLRDLCNPQAIPALIARYNTTSGETEQVKLAISEALRVLATCDGS